MTRKANESLSDFKIRVIDPISDSYCSAKWYNATIWLGHGQTTSCHHPPAHQIDPEEIKTNPSAIHNTQHKKKMRQMMLDGTRPHECEYCWKVEDIGRGNISDRVYKTEIYKDEDIAATAKMPWDADVDLKTLEISFERTCNFACSYCNPAFSTTWVNDIKKFGPYRNIISDGRGHFIDTSPWAANAAEKEEDNPFIQAFWKWWESSLSDNLEEIRITGGEPLMAPSVWKLFDWFKNNPEKAGRLRYAVNSNLHPKKAILDKLIEMSHHVPHLEIYTSNESVGAHSEYIRDGLDYNQWLLNIDRLITEGNIKALHMMMTINSLCLASIVEFMEAMLNIKRKHGAQYVSMSLNILRFPSFQACAILPEAIKHKYKEKLEAWYLEQVEKDEKDFKGWTLFNDWERAQTLRLIDYLDVVKTPHKNTADQNKLYNDFKNFYLQYDTRRGKNFRETFPEEYVEFLDSINVEVPTKEEVLTNCYVSEKVILPSGDPATTADYDKDTGHGWDTKNDTLGKNE